MYRGKRDPMLGIVVNQSYCEEFVSSDGRTWIEVFVPPHNISSLQSGWSSIAVPPEQVFYLDDIYNEVFVNAGALLTGLYKEYNADGVRVPVSSEKFKSEEMLARFLQLEAVMQGRVKSGRDTIVDDIYHVYISSGMKMLAFIRNGC